MELIFLGKGEAFDTHRSNSSYLIRAKQDLMIDCGYTSTYSLRRFLENRGGGLLDGSPDVVLITHYHGDHLAGLSSLLVPLWDEVRNSERKKELVIASAHPDIQERVERRLEEDYPGLYKEFRNSGFEVNFQVLNPKGDSVAGLEITSAMTSHSVPNYAYRLNMEDGSFAISGDGAFTNESRVLYKGVGLLIHEGFFVNNTNENHASIKDVADYAIANGIPKVGVVHVNQTERKRSTEIEKIVAQSKEQGVDLFFPVDHQTLNF